MDFVRVVHDENDFKKRKTFGIGSDFNQRSIDLEIFTRCVSASYFNL